MAVLTANPVWLLLCSQPYCNVAALPGEGTAACSLFCRHCTVAVRHQLLRARCQPSVAATAPSQQLLAAFFNLHHLIFPGAGGEAPGQRFIGLFSQAFAVEGVMSVLHLNAGLVNAAAEACGFFAYQPVHDALVLLFRQLLAVRQE